VAHYEESFLDPENTLFKDEAQIEAYTLDQWWYAYTYTFYAINDAVFANTFNQDIR